MRRHKDFANTRCVPTPVYHPGDKVWLYTRDLRLRLQSKKLSPHYIGPFTIQRQINKVTYLLTLPAQYHVHPAFYVSLLKPFFPSALGPVESEVPLSPEIIEEPTIYRVQEILDSRRRGGWLEYLINWEGYGTEDRSWVPRDDVLEPFLLAEYHHSHLNRPGAVAVLVAKCGRQEPPVEEGVLSGIQSHHPSH